MSGRRRWKRHVGPDKLHHLRHGHDLSPHQNTYAPGYGITGYFLRGSEDIYRPYALPGQPSSSSPYMPIHYHIDGIHRILCFLFAPVSVLVLSVPHVLGCTQTNDAYQPTQYLPPAFLLRVISWIQISRSLAPPSQFIQPIARGLSFPSVLNHRPPPRYLKRSPKTHHT